MKGNMMILAPLWLLLCWMSPEGSMAVMLDEEIPLSMEECSVDDMYYDCTEEMMDIVKNDYLNKEKTDSLWDEDDINTCTKDKVEKNKIDALTEDHLRAICIYTHKIAYKPFNDAVRTEKEKYGEKNDANSDSSFKYHSLHYLLTSAIQILKQDQDNCLTVYRRTEDVYTGNENQIIRFVMFASSSLRTDLTKFGSNSCFKIETCYGADMTDYETNAEQKEVLIPPYEKFKITKIYDGKGTFKKLKDCMKVFVLESAGYKTDLNCKLVPTKTKPVDKD